MVGKGPRALQFWRGGAPRSTIASSSLMRAQPSPPSIQSSFSVLPCIALSYLSFFLSPTFFPYFSLSPSYRKELSLIFIHPKPQHPSPSLWPPHFLFIFLLFSFSPPSIHLLFYRLPAILLLRHLYPPPPLLMSPLSVTTIIESKRLPNRKYSLKFKSELS